MGYRGQIPCPYCKDSTFLHIQTKEDRSKGKIGEAIVPCCCTNATIINKIFPLLSTVSDPPAEEFLAISKQLTEIKDNKRVIKNYIFYGEERKFLYLFKSVALFYWSSLSSFEILDGLQVVLNYYVGKDENTLYDLLKFNLLGLIFTSASNNQAIPKTVLDTIKNRMRYGTATWVYSQSPSSLQQSQEYSSDLQTILDEYSLYDLSRDFVYPGFGSTESKVVKHRQSVQRSLSNF